MHGHQAELQVLIRPTLAENPRLMSVTYMCTIFKIKHCIHTPHTYFILYKKGLKTGDLKMQLETHLLIINLVCSRRSDREALSAPTRSLTLSLYSSISALKQIIKSNISWTCEQ